jgi:hypothetical protein
VVDRDREAAALERELGVWQERRQRQMRALWGQRRSKEEVALARGGGGRSSDPPLAAQATTGRGGGGGGGIRAGGSGSTGVRRGATIAPPPFALAEQCAACFGKFGLTRRRHHCRACGGSFCQQHAAGSAPLPALGFGGKPVRVCDGCSESTRICASLAAHEEELRSPRKQNPPLQQRPQELPPPPPMTTADLSPGPISYAGEQGAASPAMSPAAGRGPTSPMLFAMSPVA